MVNTFIGNLGHLLVIIAFVSAIVTFIGYGWATKFQNQEDSLASRSWKRFSRMAFGLHAFSIIGVVVSLFYIIYYHLYEYHYAWAHSSDNLPIYYMISCFWEGQEGSFLLWIFWHVCLGGVLIMTNKTWEAPVMTIFSAVQIFLTSMILGVVLWNYKLGSDPFILLRDVMTDAPVYQAGSPVYNPNFIPEDGRGLNPLLQNYWMVIHPPTLFLGFATTLIPFAYCIAGLWQRKYRDWVRPALPWALFSAAILGLGILMGGYWAYETLNFGGYWNWDPVENAVFVPWLVLVAAIHTMIAFKKSNTALKSAIILNITTFLLILYATFLTRSGILGNASVHSFTDLGLSGQLLIYLLAFLFLSIGLIFWRWKEIPASEKEISMYSREFWIFMGATVLCLAGFQVLFTTSIPVFNKIIELFGYVGNIALPTDQVAHYTKFQFWGAVLIALLSGTGQFFWWKKIDKTQLKNALALPVILTLLLSAIWIAVDNMQNFSFILLLTTSIYSIIANFTILMSLMRKGTFKLSGGAVSHIGVAMMLLGILYSSGYSKVISVNMTGKPFSVNWNKDDNENHVIVWLNEPLKMGDYQVTYKGDFVEVENVPSYVKKTALMPTENPYKAIAFEDIQYNGKTYFKKGDSVRLPQPENVFFELEYRDNKGKMFSLFPRAQQNPQMGNIASPAIHRQWNKDLYTYRAPIPLEEKEWSETEEFTVTLGDTFFVKDMVAIFESREPVNQAEVMRLTASSKSSQNDIGIEAKIKILGKSKNYVLSPIFLIKDNEVGLIPDVEPDLAIRISLQKIDTQTGKFTFGVNTTTKDNIILKSIEKPLINVLWIGTLVLMLGFGIAIYRRYTEFVKMRDKGLE